MKQIAYFITALAVIGPCFAAGKVLGTSKATVQVDGPVVVGFFPRVTQDEVDHDDGGISEGQAHVSFALEDTVKCLKAAGVTAHVQYEMTDALVVHEGKSTKTLRLSKKWPRSVGAYLFLPGKSPRLVAAQAGPSSLITLLPEAATEYFGAATCKEPK